jgi:hypothetical protein
MRFANGGGSWRVQVQGASPLHECALWIREAERLPVPAGGPVPGHLELDHVLPPPSRRTDPAWTDEWPVWWRSIVGVPPLDATAWLRTGGAPPEPAFDTPDPLGLAPLPALRKVVARRADEAVRWWRETVAGPPGPDDVRVGPIVREVQADLGRPLRPFEVTFVVLPVHDDVIRQTADHHYLVPRRVFVDGIRWDGWLRDLVRTIG